MRKPKLIVSKCLDMEKCRYDGQTFTNKAVSMIKDYADVKSVCPEKGIGLKVPRDPIRVEKHDSEYKLVQLKTNADYTCQMNEFAEEFLNKIDDVDGFILKSRSPSCGIKDVRIYPKESKCSLSRNGKGFFAQKVLEKYSKIPIEDEGRLKNYNIRDEFFTRIFAINSLKAADNIADFHDKNYLLLQSYDKKMTEELEKIIDKDDLYRDKVLDILSKKRSRENKLNVIKSVFEKYKKNLNTDEISYFEKILNLYKEQRLPFSCLKIALTIYAFRFSDMETINQTFFNPYPESLVSVTDSGKGRNL